MNILKIDLRKLKKTIMHLIGYLDHEGEVGNKGERVDLDLSKPVSDWQLDIYQKNHIERYKFAMAYLNSNDICADMACGSGYGTFLLSQKCQHIIGIDIDEGLVKKISQRYKTSPNIEFKSSNILNINYISQFDKIISFETIEHLDEKHIPDLFRKTADALKSDGKLIFSVPLMQEKSKEAIAAGFHKKFDIDIKKISYWLDNSGLKLEKVFFQNYMDHAVREISNKNDDFILCVVSKF